MENYKAVVHARDVVCQYCGSSKNLTVHHIRPKCQRGPNTPENCILLCRDCHRTLHEQQGYPHGDKHCRLNGRRKDRRR